MKVLGALFLLLVLAAAGAYFWISPQLAALTLPGLRQGPVTLVVPPGANMKQVTGLLQEAGFVKDSRVLYYYARQQKIGTPKAGEYEITPELSPRAMLEKFHRGEVMQHELGFPDGLTYKEIAKRFEDSDLIDAKEMVTLCENEAFLKAHGIPGATCEGYLYPDVYKFARGKTTKDLLGLFIARHNDVFTKQVAPLLAGAQKQMSHFQFLTMASIVEKETGAESDRPHIASVYLNRLKIGQRLEADPTVIYALTLRGNFNGNLKHDDLLQDIPYNTYKRAGLPPGPICNPGLRAMLATAQPLPSNDLFFVSRNDGTSVFCPNYACHEAAVQKWQVQYFKKKH